jgi:glyoxylase-like metal-dependent hydrolase (beta-lactamase superfamily II)
VTIPAPSSPPVPVSQVQAEAVAAGTVPPVERIRDGVWSVSIPFGAGIPDSTLTYVLDAGDGSLAVIDPGWGTEESLDVLADALRSVGRSLDDVDLVLVTHWHVDHLGAATALRDRSGARIAMHPAEVAHLHAWDAERALDDADVRAWGLPDGLVAGVIATWGSGRRPPIPDPASFSVDLELQHGDELVVGQRTLRVVHTPGHTPGHVCFAETRSDADGLLFTGDHVLPRINSGLGLGGRVSTNPLEDYLASLRLLDGYGDLEACPGHEYRFRDVVARARVLTEHRAERTRHVADALDALDRPTLYEVAARVPFRGGIESMSGYLLASAVAQTGYHAELLGRAHEIRRA